MKGTIHQLRLINVIFLLYKKYPQQKTGEAGVGGAERRRGVAVGGDFDGGVEGKGL